MSDMKTEQPQPNCNKDAQSIFEHNKGIFHLGQCPDCFQSNVINPKPPQEAFTRQDFIKLLEAPTPTRMTPTAQDIEQWKKEAEAEYPHDEKDGYLYNDFQDSSREGFVAGRQKSFEEYWKRIQGGPCSIFSRRSIHVAPIRIFTLKDETMEKTLVNIKELRIGNYLWGYFNSQDVGNPQSAPLIQVTDKRALDQYSWDSPIPLTEGWLIGFGFTETQPNQWEVGEFFCVEDHDNGNGTRSWFYDVNNPRACDCCPSTELFYVHQLQNLYFAVELKELNQAL